MNPKILGWVIGALAILARWHVTVWLLGHPVATMPALTALIIAVSPFIAAFAFLLWRIHAASFPAWRTA